MVKFKPNQENIRARMNDKYWSQIRLSLESGISTSTIENILYKEGHCCNYNTASKIAKALDDEELFIETKPESHQKRVLSKNWLYEVLWVDDIIYPVE